jgi:hypothetical protein
MAAPHDFRYTAISLVISSLSLTATAKATENQTVGLFSMPMRRITSTCAGMSEEPTN